MKRFSRILAIILTIALVTAAAAVTASAAEPETTQKVVCFTNTQGTDPYVDVAATDTAPAYREYTAIVDGKIQKVKLLPQKTLFGGAGYLTLMAGPSLATFNEDGYIEYYEDIPNSEVGFSTHGVNEAGKLVLGVEEKEYTMSEDFVVYLCSEYHIPDPVTMNVADLGFKYTCEYTALVDDAGEVYALYLNLAMMDVMGNGDADAEGLYPTIQKFKSGWGSKDEKTGYATEYVYYEPEAEAGEEYPLVIWFHGLNCGYSTWSSLFNFNDIARFATEGFQSQFASGGAYVMAPRANEDLQGGTTLDGKASGWGVSQVQAVYNAIDEFIEAHPNVDTDRIYVGGFSMGGGMTWWMIRERPDFFAAAFPCCPIGFAVPSGEELDSFASMPIWEFHGSGDPVVPSAVTTDIADTLLSNAKATGTDSRVFLLPSPFLMPDGVTPIPNEHLCWCAVLNNLKYYAGDLYKGTGTAGEFYKDVDGKEPASTVIDWLNGQTASANAARKLEAVFTDVNADQWHYKYVMPLYEANVVVGIGGGLYAPDAALKYGEALKLIMLAGGYDKLEPSGEHWASGFVDKAVADGLIPAAVNPELPIDRKTMASIVVTVLKLDTSNVGKSPFTDADDPAITALYEAGIVDGHGNGTFTPDASFTRAQAAKIVYNIMEYDEA